MTPQAETALLEALERALTLECSPSEREVDDLRALVAGPPGSVYVLPRVAPAAPPRRPLVRAATAAVAAAAAVALTVVVTHGGADAPRHRPGAAAPVAPPIDVAPRNVEREVAAVRDAVARADLEQVLVARDELLRALDALPPGTRAQLQPEVDALLVEVQAFLDDATRPAVTVPPQRAEPSSEAIDDSTDDVVPNDVVTTTPSTTPRTDDRPEPEDDR